MRLDKFLSSCGLGSRKEVKKLIKDKRICVNGSFNVKDSLNINESEDKVFFDDELLEYKEFYYILLNKPKGYLSATEDASSPTVLDLIVDYNFVHLFPVGRLDKDTTGCLLLTNDGPLAHRLLSPKYHVDKVYEAEIDKEIYEWANENNGILIKSDRDRYVYIFEQRYLEKIHSVLENFISTFNSCFCCDNLKKFSNHRVILIAFPKR